jgi:hypothetical protein
MLESILESVNYGVEYCGAAFFLLLHLLESTHFLALFCSAPLFSARLSL